MNVILVGTDDALLEGLAQTFAASDMRPHVVPTLMDAAELAVDKAPIVVVVERSMAMQAAGEAMAIRLAPGGSLVLYRGEGSGETDAVATPAMLQRSVLAELTLPLERKRLVALAAHVRSRAITTGRSDAVYHPPLEVRP